MSGSKGRSSLLDVFSDLPDISFLDLSVMHGDGKMTVSRLCKNMVRAGDACERPPMALQQPSHFGEPCLAPHELEYSVAYTRWSNAEERKMCVLTVYVNPPS